MKEEYKKEILDFINDNNLYDIFTYENIFYNLYNCNLRIYLRVSTDGQDFGRQILEVYDWAKKKDIKIFIENIFFDKYTGKSIDRDGYLSMRSSTLKNDYIFVTEVSRLGRDWDEIKKEWYRLKAEEINILVMDYDLLSSTLPNEKNVNMTVDRKFMQENIFNAILYASCKKIEEVRRTTKAGVAKARKAGKRIGRPTGKATTRHNFIKTLRLVVNEKYKISKALRTTFFPKATYFDWLKKLKNELNTNDLKEILETLEKGDI